MAVVARQHIRRMRGGACAHLLLADDDRYYVVKFRNNPQHARVLVNELICTVLLDYLGLPTPRGEIVMVDRDLIESSPGLTLESGKRSWPCEPGLHFGSKYPVNPIRTAVFDYLPRALLGIVLNADSFLGILAFDKWVSNANGRQAVFFRDRARKWLSEAEARVSSRSPVYVVNMIDHGFAFHAHHWSFEDSPERGLYVQREVYQDVQGLDSFEPWLSRIENCPTEILDDAYKRVPAEWHGGAWDELESLLENLYKRRSRVAELVSDSKRAAKDPFPQWSGMVRGG